MTQPPTVDSPAGDRSAAANPVWEFVSAPADLALPDFAAIAPAHIVDAGDRVVAAVRQSVTALLASGEEPSFASVTLPLERAQLPARALAAFVRVLESNVLDDALAEAVAEVSAQLTSLRLSIELDEQLFDRLGGVPVSELIPEDRRLHELTVTRHVRAGVRLPAAERETVAEIARELDRLETEFGQVLVQETAARALTTDDPADLEGLGPDRIAAAHAASEAASGASQDAAAGPQYRLPLVNTSQQDALASLVRPETRARLMELSLGRGSSGGPGDTRGLVTDITALRAAQAAHLGYHSYAQYSVDDSTAGDVESAGNLLQSLLEPAQRQFEREAGRVREYFGLGGNQPLARHDILRLWERYRAEAFEVDAEEAAAHFEFERVLTDGVFAAANALYGLAFALREDLAGWHPDVRVYEVTEGSRTLGLVLVDPFARTGKRGGAWMDELVTGSRLTGLHPVTTLTLNVPAPAPGRPALLTPDETVTLFHEFGHVLHGLFADSSYPSQAGTAVPRDYVEFPSQQFEMWALHPQVLPGYARHWETGAPISAELVQRLRDAQTFGQGFATLEYLAAAMLDLSWHSLEDGEVIEDVLAFEAEVLAAAGFEDVVPPRYRTAYFQHIFSGGYAAGYYSYLWSEQYAAAVSELFEDHGGLDPELGRAYREGVLAPGYSRDPLTALDRFLGGEAGVEPLLRRRGLAPARPAPPACPEHARLERDLREAGITSRVQVHPEPLPTAQAAAEFHGVPVEAIANSLVFIAEFPDEEAIAAAESRSLLQTGEQEVISAQEPASASGETEAEAASSASAEAGDAEVPVIEEPVLIMTSGGHRVDTEFAAEQIGALRLKRARPEQVLAATGQAVGGVAPAGHPAHVRSYVDRTLRGHAQLWAGGGTVEAMVPLTYAELVRVTRGEEIDVRPQ
ncbi:M3 family metallopeptidase [Brevibacterium album]|uniref:M3 family metallopeptidase n=1 Tax=Brevibacterium album TaxID=417948 RepID=UPI000404FC5B|nr:M3 family metallopeptidase [Brevibacterium album]